MSAQVLVLFTLGMAAILGSAVATGMGELRISGWLLVLGTAFFLAFVGIVAVSP